MINLTSASGESTASFGSPFPGQGVPYGAGTGRTANFGYSALGGAQGRGTGKFGSRTPMLSSQATSVAAPNLSTPAEAMGAPVNLSGPSEAPQATTINQHFHSGAAPAEGGQQANPQAELAE